MNSLSEQKPPVDVEDLVWAMLDQHISEDEFRRLDDLLRDDEDARRLYLQCVQLHVDLASFYAAKDKSGADGLLGLPLGIVFPTIDATLADPAI